MKNKVDLLVLYQLVKALERGPGVHKTKIANDSHGNWSIPGTVSSPPSVSKITLSIVEGRKEERKKRRECGGGEGERAGGGGERKGGGRSLTQV